MGPMPHLYEAGEPVIDADDWLAELAKCPKEAARLHLEHEKAQAAGKTGAWFNLLDWLYPAESFEAFWRAEDTARQEAVREFSLGARARARAESRPAYGPEFVAWARAEAATRADAAGEAAWLEYFLPRGRQWWDPIVEAFAWLGTEVFTSLFTVTG